MILSAMFGALILGLFMLLSAMRKQRRKHFLLQAAYKRREIAARLGA